MACPNEAKKEEKKGREDKKIRTIVFRHSRKALRIPSENNTGSDRMFRWWNKHLKQVLKEFI